LFHGTPRASGGGDIFKDINSLDKSVIEKVSLVEQLDKKDKVVFFTMLDALVAKKKFRDSLHAAFGNKWKSPAKGLGIFAGDEGKHYR
jgi:hypothetical protein